MKSFIAALRTLVLPFGATSGARIVLNGIAGVIEVYDATNQRVVLIRDTGLVLTPDEAETINIGHDAGGTHPVISFHSEALASIEGRIDLLVLGSYDVGMRFAAPVDAGNDQAEFLMLSEDSSSGLPPTFRFRDNPDVGTSVDLLQLDGGATSRMTVRTDELSLPSSITKTISGTTSAVGTLQFTHGASVVPKQIMVTHESPIPGSFLIGVDTYTATTAVARFDVNNTAVQFRATTVI